MPQQHLKTSDALLNVSSLGASEIAAIWQVHLRQVHLNELLKLVNLLDSHASEL